MLCVARRWGALWKEQTRPNIGVRPRYFPESVGGDQVVLPVGCWNRPEGYAGHSGAGKKDLGDIGRMRLL